MDVKQPNPLLEFIKQNKQLLLVSVPLLLTLFVVIAFIVFANTNPPGNTPQTKKTNTRPTPITNPTIAKEKLAVSSIFPRDEASGVGIYSKITVTFAKSVSSQEKQAIKLAVSPSVAGSSTWSSDNKTLLFTPTQSFASETAYTITLTSQSGDYAWNFQTISNAAISEEEIMKTEESSAAFTKQQEAQFNKNYPWWNKFPLQSENYFAYFDPQKKKFIGLLYPQTSASQSVESQAQQMKAEILARIRSIGINVDTYGIEWQVTPEP